MAPEAILDENDSITQDPREISDIIQASFNHKLKTVQISLGQRSGNYLRVIRNLTRGRCRTFKFESVTREDVLLQIRKSPNKSSMGVDNISYEILKMVDIHVAGSLRDTVNMSLKGNTFPSSW